MSKDTPTKTRLTAAAEPARDRRPQGVDVSRYQPNVDWKKLAASKIAFAFIKASDGGTSRDKMFVRHRQDARNAGIPAGPYHFFRPKTKVSLQVSNFGQAVGALLKGELPPVVDLENPDLWKGIPAREAADMAVEMLVGVERQFGVNPIIYSGRYFVRDNLGSDPRLAAYPLWLAAYRKTEPPVPAPFRRWTFWQYSETGSVPGVPGNVDRDLFNGTMSQLRKFVIS